MFRYAVFDIKLTYSHYFSSQMPGYTQQKLRLGALEWGQTSDWVGQPPLLLEPPLSVHLLPQNIWSVIGQLP